jgi:hypothetical protein
MDEKRHFGAYLHMMRERMGWLEEVLDRGKALYLHSTFAFYNLRTLARVNTIPPALILIYLTLPLTLPSSVRASLYLHLVDRTIR